MLSGSIVGWGGLVEDAFDLIVFLQLDAAIRVERLRRNPIPAAWLAELGISAESRAADFASERLAGHVARRDGRLHGDSFGDLQTGEVAVLALLPEAEGQGLGRQLLSRVEDGLCARGHRRRCLVCAADPNGRSYGFYRHLGWRGTGRIDAHGDERLERED